MTDAFISIDQVVSNWLLKRSKSIHYYIDVILLGAEAVQELAYTSLPMIKHTLLTKVSGQNYFNLPSGYAGIVKVGVRYGDIWWPLPIADRLMPYPNSAGNGDMNAAEFGSDMNIEGDSASWYSSPTNAASFSGTDFASGFNITASGGGSTASAPLLNGWYNGSYSGYFNASYNRWYGVSIDAAQGRIVIPEGFPHEEIYLQYTGIGAVDNMTEIDRRAMAAIQAYIDWKYAANNRNTGRGEAQDWERKWDVQHRLLRARLQQMSIEDINRIFDVRRLSGRIIRWRN